MINVVGGSGFIGSRLCTLLTKEKVAFGIVDKNVSQVFHEKTILADVRSVEALTDALAENAILINLAAEHRLSLEEELLIAERVEPLKNLRMIAFHIMATIGEVTDA